jgi:hypothetical protein
LFFNFLFVLVLNTFFSLTILIIINFIAASIHLYKTGKRAISFTAPSTTAKSSKHQP